MRSYERIERFAKAGLAKTIITPQKPIWLAGYADRDREAEGKVHDLWVKALLLEDVKGHKLVLLTSDLCGIPKWMFDNICEEVQRKFGLGYSQIRITYSHSHCSPVIKRDLECYYPVKEIQQRSIDEYSHWLERQILTTIERAFENMRSAVLSAGEGICTFAVNRRHNQEGEIPFILARGEKPKGPVDHSVPVLAVRDGIGNLIAIVFAYACHNTTMNFYKWCGDYAGFAQIALERAHPGATAMFVAGCGGDQNPLPRRSLELCEKYGQNLADSVEEVLRHRMREIEPIFKSNFAFVNLDYDKVVSKEELAEARASEMAYRRRWAEMMLKMQAEGVEFTSSYPYAIQVWKLGDLLWISLAGEALVDYALRFKREFGESIWVTSYAHYLVGYIPSKRNWEEGGYEVNSLWEYGHPAERWAQNTEERIALELARIIMEIQ